MNVARYKEYAENELLCNSAIDMLYGVVVEETKTPFGLAEEQHISSRETFAHLFKEAALHWLPASRAILPVLIVLQPVAIRGIEKPGFFVYSEENETLTELALIRKEERLNPQMLIGSVQAPLAIGYAIYASNLTIEQSYKELAEAVHRMNHLLEIHGGLMYRMSLRKPGNKVHYVKVDDVYLAPFYFIKEIEDLNGGLHNEKIE